MRGTGFEPAQALSYSLSYWNYLKGCSFDRSDTLAFGGVGKPFDPKVSMNFL
jgi:hypothetical protein